MDEIFNDPIISHFLQSVKEDNKKSTLRELVLLGIHSVSSKIHENACKCAHLCPCVKVNHPYFQNQTVNTANGDFNLAREINEMRARIDELALKANSTNYNQPITFNNRQLKERKSLNKQNIEAVQQYAVENEGEGVRKQFRHHLDDSEVRKVLINPYAPASPVKKQKRKQQLQKLHQLQKQKDAMEIKTLKERAEKYEKDYESIEHKQTNAHYSDSKRKKQVTHSINDENITEGDRQFKKTKNSSVNQTKSKIKSLIQKDKEKIKNVSMKKVQQEKRIRLCQFEYSDQEQAVSDDVKEESECPIHSRYRQNQQSQEQISMSKDSKAKKREFKQSNKMSRKDADQSANRQDEESDQRQQDQVSQSSSFSKFSMSSLRENGKISKLRK